MKLVYLPGYGLWNVWSVWKNVAITVEKANCIPFERTSVEVTSPWHLFDSSHHVGPPLGLFSGIHSKSLIPGVDCPEGATFLNVSFFGETMVKATTLERAMCVFEQNTGVPLRRHLSYSVDEGAFYGGMPDSVLTVRSILAIYNYDYIMDFIFHQVRFI